MKNIQSKRKQALGQNDHKCLVLLRLNTTNTQRNT